MTIGHASTRPHTHTFTDRAADTVGAERRPSLENNSRLVLLDPSRLLRVASIGSHSLSYVCAVPSRPACPQTEPSPSRASHSMLHSTCTTESSRLQRQEPQGVTRAVEQHHATRARTYSAHAVPGWLLGDHRPLHQPGSSPVVELACPYDALRIGELTEAVHLILLEGPLVPGWRR